MEAPVSFAEGRVPWGLAQHFHGVHGVQGVRGGVEHLRVAAAEADPETLLTVAGGRPIVVVARHAHRCAAARTLVEKLAANAPVALVEMGWPSAWRPAGVRAFVATYGASQANGRAAATALGMTTLPRSRPSTAR